MVPSRDEDVPVAAESAEVPEVSQGAVAPAVLPAHVAAAAASGVLYFLTSWSFCVPHSWCDGLVYVVC